MCIYVVAVLPFLTIGMCVALTHVMAELVLTGTSWHAPYQAFEAKTSRRLRWGALPRTSHCGACLIVLQARAAEPN